MTKINDANRQTVNLVNLLRFFLSYWKWYLLSFACFVSYFIYEYSKSPYIYNRSATVMIRTSSNTPETVRINRGTGALSANNGAMEIQQLQTKEIMRDVITRLNADISCTIKDGLRWIDLYQKAPVLIDLPDAGPDDSFSFNLTYRDSKSVELSSDKLEKRYTLILGDTLNTPFGRIRVTAPDGNNIKRKWDTPMRVTKYQREYMVQYFLANLVILQPKTEIPILKISVNDLSPLRASDILYTLINIFNEKSIEEKSRVAVNAGKFIDDRLVVIEKELYSIEDNLEMLKEKSEGLAVATKAGMYISDSREYQSRRKAIDVRLQLLNSLRLHMRDDSGIQDLIPNISGLESGEMDKLIDQYNKLLLRRNRLSGGNSRNNPVLKELDMALSAQRAMITRKLDDLYSDLILFRNNNIAEESQAREGIMSIPAKEREVLTVERQQKVKENLYVFLLNKREENALNGALTDSNMRILDPPSGGTGPVSPVRSKKLLLGLLCGLCFPTVILLLIYKFDTRVRTQRDITDSLTIPFLGVVPLDKKKAKNDYLVIKSDGRDALSESFRILRTNLSFIAPSGSGKKVLTFISFTPGAGKTFLTSNLALCLSFAGKKVLILDLDLRKATISKSLGCDARKGVSLFLSDQSTVLSEVIEPNFPTAGIDFIPAGIIPPNPSELLMSSRLDEMVMQLREQYDYVLIDNVPVGIIADASITNRVTDVNMFVIPSGKVSREQLLDLELLYRDHKYNNMNIILNGVQKSARYGYGYGYS